MNVGRDIEPIQEVRFEPQVKYRLYLFDRDLISPGFLPPIGQAQKTWIESDCYHLQFENTKDAHDELQKRSGNWALPQQINWHDIRLSVLLGVDVSANFIYFSKDDKLVVWGFAFFKWVS